MEATLWCQLGFQVEDDSQDQCGAEQILQIDDAADCAGSLDPSCMKCDKRVSVAEHFHNLSPYSLHSMIEVFAKASYAILYHVTVTPWQYPPSVHGLACYSVSSHALAVPAEAWHAYHALAVSAEAWHAIL